MWHREQSCPWDMNNVFSHAAMCGHLDILIWARDHGCPWDSYTCSNAARNGHLDILIWARDHGCLWDPVLCRYTATIKKRQHIIDWMTSIDV